MDILPLEHEARTKQHIKDALYQFLYDPVVKHFKSRLDTLIIRNTLMGGFAHRHFVFKGVLYNAETTHPPLRRNRLVPQLKAPMEEYLAELEQLNNQELPYVLGFINQVLNSSNDLTDYMRVFPSSLHHPLQKLMATCPCRATHLTEEKVESLQARNETPIDMMQRRMVTNLLI